MRRSVASLALLALLGTFSPPALLAGDEPADLPLYPLKKGLKWEIARTSGTDKRSFEVTGIEVRRNLACYELTCRSKTFPDGTPAHKLAVKEDGVYIVECGANDYYDPPLCMLKQPRKEVQSWDYVGHLVVKGLDGKPFICETKFSFVQYSDTIKHKGKDVSATLVVKTQYSGKDSDLKGAAWCRSSEWFLPGQGTIKRRYEIYEKGTWQIPPGDTEWVTVAFSGTSSMTIGEIVLNKAEVEKEASSEAVEGLPGVVTEFKKSRTISREVSCSTKLGLGAELEAKIAGNLLVIKGELTARVKGSIEKDSGEKLTDSETREQTVKIDGDRIQKARITWIDTYRTGTVSVTLDGQTYSVPFQFPLGTKLVIRKQ